MQSALATAAVVVQAATQAAPAAPSTGTWVESSAFWVSFVAVLVALFAAVVSYITYRSQADPEVIVFCELDPDRSSIMNLVVMNVGRAVALDVTFESSSPIPSEAFGLDKASAPEAEPMTTGPLMTGIPFLQPQGRRTLSWGQYGGLAKALGDETILVTARYKSRHMGIPWKLSHTTVCPLEMASFESTDASDHNYVDKVAKAVDKVAKSVDGVAQAIKSTG